MSPLPGKLHHPGGSLKGGDIAAPHSHPQAFCTKRFQEGWHCQDLAAGSLQAGGVSVAPRTSGYKENQSCI